MIEANKGPILKIFISIKELIDYMYNQSKNVFKYTKYESNFYIYHNALAQLNENETIAYMQQKGIDKHWILPLHGLNKGTRW